MFHSKIARTLYYCDITLSITYHVAKYWNLEAIDHTHFLPECNLPRKGTKLMPELNPNMQEVAGENLLKLSSDPSSTCLNNLFKVN